MKVFYRLSPVPSFNKPPIYADDKLKLIEHCLSTYLAANESQYETVFIADSCPKDLVFKLKQFGEVIEVSGMGNVGTFHMQLLNGKDENRVLFAEDDYIWRPNALKNIDRALDDLDMVSPYDHPAHYLEERFDKRYECKLIDNIVYREAPSNTLTFAIKGRHLSSIWQYLTTFAISDHEMFQGVKERYGLRIWNPTYSFATHLVDGLLAPNVDWTPYLKTS